MLLPENEDGLARAPVDWSTLLAGLAGRVSLEGEDEMRRLVGAVATAIVGFGLVATTASAAPTTTSVFHFKGRAGAAVLTDCPLSAPVGTHCRAVDVFAFEQRVNAGGERFDGPGLNVTLFDVVITDTDPFFEAVPIGEGFSDSATVSIARNLSRGSASAVDVELCESFDCPAGAPELLSIQVSWTGFGGTTRFNSHDQFANGFCSLNTHTKGTVRDADAIGLLDGVEVVEPAVEGFQATLQTDKFGSVERCSAP
jgi:hypothetical protein